MDVYFADTGSMEYRPDDLNDWQAEPSTVSHVYSQDATGLQIVLGMMRERTQIMHPSKS